MTTNQKIGWAGLLIALLFFFVFQIVLATHVHVVEYDEAIYLNVARSLRQVGQPLRPMGTPGVLYLDHPPLYLYFLALLTGLFGERILWLRLATSAIGMVTIVLVWSTVRLYRGAISGWIAAMIVALSPFFTGYSFFLRMEVPMSCCIALSLYFTARASVPQHTERGKFRYPLAAGLALALAVLMKEFALVYGLALALFLLATRDPWSRKIGNLAAGLAPAVGALIGWAAWGMWMAPDRFRFTLERWLGSATGSQGWVDSRIAVELTAYVLAVGNQVLTFGVLGLLGIALASGLGIFLAQGRRPPWITFLTLLYPTLAILISLVISLKEPRYLMAVIPVLAVAIGLLIDWDEIAYYLQRRSLGILIGALGAGLIFWQISPLQLPPDGNLQQPELWWEPLYSQRMFESDRYYNVLKLAGEYLDSHAPEGEQLLVVHEGPVVSYYAHRPYRFLYTESLAGVEELLAAGDYLVLDHPIFVRLTAEEVEQVIQTIQVDFNLEQTIQDPYRQVMIYRRRRP